MTDLRTAAQQALEAMEQDNPSGRTATISALRAALAQEQPAPEPVAWMTHGKDPLPLFHKTKAGAEAWGAEPQPLYTTPPQRPMLTDEEIDDMWRAPMSADWEHREFARAIERKVRGEKE